MVEQDWQVHILPNVSIHICFTDLSSFIARHPGIDSICFVLSSRSELLMQIFKYCTIPLSPCKVTSRSAVRDMF